MLDSDLIGRFLAPRALGRRVQDLGRVLLAQTAGRRTPMFVQFLVTSRCTQACSYCEVPPLTTEDMAPDEVLRMLDELCRAGMRKITFSGGEPLMREALPEWIRFVRERGVFTAAITNGKLVRTRLDEIRALDVVIVSLDGPREVHEAQRGPGSHEAALEAIELCRGAGIRVMTSTTFHAHNLDHLDYVLELSRRNGTTAIFQPVEIEYAPRRERVAPLLLDDAHLRKAFQYLLDKKTAGYPVGYPRKQLQRFARGLPPERCRWAGRLYCTLLPDGRVAPCCVLVGRELAWQDARRAGFTRAMEGMPAFRCDGCYAGYAELDSILSFRFWDLV